MEINYKNLEISDYIKINTQYQAEHLFDKRNEKQLYKMFDISSDEMTNIGKYVFFIELHLYYDQDLIGGILGLSPSYKGAGDEINVFLGDVNRDDYDVKKIQKDSSLQYEYHLLIDTNVTYFEKAMKKIRKSPFYIGEYIYKDISTEKIVLIIRSMCRKHIDLCIAGKFSEIFSENNYETLTSRLSIVTNYFDLDFKNKTYHFTNESAVLCGLKKLDFPTTEADRIIKEFRIDCPKTIAVLYERHGYGEPEILK